MANPRSVNSNNGRDVLDLIGRFAEFGATDDGGVHRLAASSEDKSVRDFLCKWFEENGFITLIDAVGNIFGVLELKCRDSDRAFYCGSHLDSQPNGGRFDGALGVAISCIAALNIKQLIESGQLESSFDKFVVTCWTSEEGARFQPSLLGSRVFAGTMGAEEAWTCEDPSGVTLKQALNSIGYIGNDTPQKPTQYLEIHIEQGAQLENSKVPIGIVSSCWGARKLVISVVGQADHTGPTPMEDRKDALLAASNLVVRVREIAELCERPLHSSVGRIEVSPNSPNTVAGRVEIWIEFRSPFEEDLDAAEQILKTTVDDTSDKTGCSIRQVSSDVRKAVHFDTANIAQIANTFDRHSIGHMALTTIAGHDAVQLQSICPSTLLFVPSHEGISHSPDEFTSDEDIGCGFDASLLAIGALISKPVSGTQTGAAYV